MQTDDATTTPQETAQYDIYETGRAWPIEQLAGGYHLDPADLRRTLNLSVASMGLSEGFARPARRSDYKAIADKADALADVLDQAAIGSVTNLLMRTVADLAQLLARPEEHRRGLATTVRSLADRARAMALEFDSDPNTARKKHAPTTGATAPPGPAERAVVAALAHLWLRSHGEWPKIYDRRDYTKAGKEQTTVGRRGDMGAKFVIEAAKLIGLPMTPTRLRTVLGKVRAATRENYPRES